ncbi:MAG: MazG family protein [Stackebrandtia sp.]
MADTRIYWLVTSPRLPAGILSAQGWATLRRAAVHTAAGTAQAEAIRSAGIDVAVVPLEQAADKLLDGGGVWLAGPEGDEPLARKLSERLAADPERAELELVYGSWDPPGARLLDAVAVIDRLRSAGGCPWDAEQTHQTLAPFLLEEAYETIDAIESGDTAHLREELGDLLMQPLFHARFASEPEDGFDVDDVAGDAVDKLIRRHPHVFGDEETTQVDELRTRWEELKRAEKPERRHAVDGVAKAQPALSLAAKYLSRIDKAGVDIPAPKLPDDLSEAIASPEALGEVLLGLVSAARQAGLDPELALRRAALDFAERSRTAEDAARTAD